MAYDPNAIQTVGISTIGNTAGDTGLVTGRLVLAGGANITLSGSTAAGGLMTLTISGGAGGGGLTNINVSAGTTSNLLSAITFSNSNGVSFGLNASTLTGSIATSLTAIRISAGTTSNLLSAFTFSNGSGVSFGLDVSTITASVAAQSNQQMTMFATGNTTQSSTGTTNASSLIFRGEGIASIGITGGSVVVSVPSGGGAGFSAGISTGGNTFGTTGMADRRFVIVPGNLMQGSQSRDGAASSATLTLDCQLTSGSALQNVGSEIVQGTRISEYAIIDHIHAGVGGYGASNTGNTAGNTGTLAGTWVLAGTTNITVSASSGAAGVHTLWLSAPNAGGGGGITYSGFDPWGPADEFVVGQQGQGTFFVQPFEAQAFQHDVFYMPIFYSNATNSSGSATISFWVGLYTRNVSTLSLLASTSSTHALSASGTVGSYSLFAGLRNFTIPWTQTRAASNYWLGIGSRTTTGGANKTYSQFLVSQPNSAYSGIWGGSNNATRQFVLGQGFYSATTSAVPASIAFTQINGSGSLNLRAPVFYFASQSV